MDLKPVENVINKLYVVPLVLAFTIYFFPEPLAFLLLLVGGALAFSSNILMQKLRAFLNAKFKNNEATPEISNPMPLGNPTSTTNWLNVILGSANLHGLLHEKVLKKVNAKGHGEIYIDSVVFNGDTGIENLHAREELNTLSVDCILKVTVRIVARLSHQLVGDRSITFDLTNFAIQASFEFGFFSSELGNISLKLNPVNPDFSNEFRIHSISNPVINSILVGCANKFLFGRKFQLLKGVFKKKAKQNFEHSEQPVNAFEETQNKVRDAIEKEDWVLTTNLIFSMFQHLHLQENIEANNVPKWINVLIDLASKNYSSNAVLCMASTEYLILLQDLHNRRRFKEAGTLLYYLYESATKNQDIRAKVNLAIQQDENLTDTFNAVYAKYKPASKK
eukprot:Phypoly_transcript_10580.p1 GENE.Phypoly_transcript_10580~~Phypoly_transcript_10580.p1  ORF type:complete len:392 (+),score=55.67 Phypoly_transcript_10580:82-1257(+)